MPINGKVQALYLDRENTTALFPITKTKAVSNDNGTGLDAILEQKADKDYVTQKIAEAQYSGSGGDSSNISELIGSLATKTELTNGLASKADYDHVHTYYVENSTLDNFLPKTGGCMQGILNMGANRLVNLPAPVDQTDAVTKKYVDSWVQNFAAFCDDNLLPNYGGTMTGPINMSSNKITNLAAPTANTDVATKGYSDKTSNPKNLLDNSDFRNPVNRRGLTQYVGNTSPGFSVDRWRTNSQACLLTVNDGYLSMANNTEHSSTATQCIRQDMANVGKYIGKTLTFVAKVRGTQLRIFFEGISGAGDYADYPDWTVIYKNIYIPEGTTSIIPTLQCPKGYNWDCEWMALYEGTFTAETLPEFVPKSYAEEQAVCNQYDPLTGKYIYTEIINFGTLPASGQAEFKVGKENDVVDKVISIDIAAYNTVNTQYVYNFPFLNTSGTVCGYVRKTGNRTFNIAALVDMSVLTATVYIKYTLV